jgi:RNA polymerase sigma factor, sigma-70 family
MTENEQIIISKLQLGDVAALETVYKEYADKLYSFALSISKNKEIAEDVTANVFIKLYTYLSNGNGIGNLKSFLYTSVRNAVYDNFKYSSRNIPLPEDDIFVDDTTDMSRQVIIKEALDTLPADEREITLLYCYGGFLHKEIADILDIPEGTVRWKYRKALNTLKSRLGGIFDD